MHLPAAKKLHKEVGAIALVEQLRDEVQVGDEGGLQDDGHVARVEEFDGVRVLLPTCPPGSHRQVNTPPLHHQPDNHQTVDVQGSLQTMDALLAAKHVSASA